MNDPLIPTEREIAWQTWLGGEERAPLRAALKRALNREAMAAGIVPDDDAILDRMKTLATEGADGLLADRKFVAAQVAADLRIEQWLDTFAPSREEAERLYEERLTGTVRPARVRLRHILITINDTLPENSREQVIERIAAVAADPAPFEKKAAATSECPSALNGGDLGVVEPERLYPEIAAALADMTPGDPPVTVETDIGFHLVELLERIPAATLTRDEGIAAASALLTKRLQKGRLAALTAEVQRALAGANE